MTSLPNFEFVMHDQVLALGQDQDSHLPWHAEHMSMVTEQHLHPSDRDDISIFSQIEHSQLEHSQFIHEDTQIEDECASQIIHGDTQIRDKSASMFSQIESKENKASKNNKVIKEDKASNESLEGKETKASKKAKVTNLPKYSEEPRSANVISDTAFC